MFASIIVDISIESLDRPFTYHIPDRLLERITPGTKVSVPFGRGNRVITGYILELMDRPRFDADKIKDIIDVVVEQSASEGRLIELAAYIKRQYGSTMNTALKTVLPIKQSYKPKEKKTIELIATTEETIDRKSVV